MNKKSIALIVLCVLAGAVYATENTLPMENPTNLEVIDSGSGLVNSDLLIEAIDKVEADKEVITSREVLITNEPVARAKVAFSALGVKARTASNIVDRFYQEFYRSQPSLDFIWLTNEAKLNESGNIIYGAIKASRDVGLSPNIYHLVMIDTLLAKSDLTKEQKTQLDLLLTESALSYARDLAVGRPEVMRADREWLLERKSIDVVPLVLAGVLGGTLSQVFIDIEPKQPDYQRIKQAMIDYAKTIDETKDDIKLTLGKKLALGDNSDRVAELRARLVLLGGLDAKQLEDKAFDKTLEEAVKSFQQNNFLEPDGVVGTRTQQALNLSRRDRLNQLRVNLERWRWMPEDMGAHYLVVDLPGFEYYIIKEGKEVMRAKTVVGMAQRSTPVFMAKMNHIVFSPYWNVPRSMAIKDKLPLLKKDPYRLARSKIRIIDKNGNEIDPSMIDWSRYNTNNFPYRLRQDPGSYNALGKVKFMFPNKHAIYLHDTPQKGLFSKTERTFSSGCIRVENPIELAQYFLKDQDWQTERVKKAYNGTRENTVHLKEAMRFPVYTLYMTVKVDDKGEIAFRSDIYNRDQAMINSIERMEMQSNIGLIIEARNRNNAEL